MKQSEIKTECELSYTIITNAEENLIRLRSICKHPNTFEGTFGVTCPPILCCDCGENVSTLHWKKLGDLNREEV